MCGIAGIINLDSQKVEENNILNMMKLMKHRGPDDEGVFCEENVGLGFVRLSIIELSMTGHQPKFSEDKRYVIVFNGEIFNYIELREELEKEGVTFKTKTDTEVLLNAYIKWGEDCLNRFNGMWAFVILDRKNNEVFAARDRFGVKPFYYIYNDDQFSFCSEIPPLLQLLKEKPTPNKQAIFDYMVFNRTDQTEETFFNEVVKLQHGTKIFIKDKKLRIEKWYDLKMQVEKSKGFANADEFKQLFSASIGLRLRSDVPVGVSLSGGLDSSSIVSVLQNEYLKHDLNTFSAVYDNGEVGDEKQFINEYKDSLKNMYFVSPDAESLEKDLRKFVQAHSEPIPTTGPYAQYKVMELAKGKVVVLLDGQGADEQLAGYPYFFGFYFKDLFKSLRIGLLIKEMFLYVKLHRSLYGIKTFLYFSLPKSLKTIISIGKKKYLNKTFVDTYKGKNSIVGTIYASNSLKESLLNHFEYKLEHLLKWEDANSMRFSIEARVPFLDYRLVEKTLATQSDLILKNGMTKSILREAMKNILPEKIRSRRDKIGFETPQEKWFKKESWQKIIFGILKSKSFKEREIIDPDKAIEMYENYLADKINISTEIWKWIHLELWFREYIDNKNENTITI